MEFIVSYKIDGSSSSLFDSAAGGAWEPYFSILLEEWAQWHTIDWVQMAEEGAKDKEFFWECHLIWILF